MCHKQRQQHNSLAICDFSPWQTALVVVSLSMLFPTCLFNTSSLSLTRGGSAPDYSENPWGVWRYSRLRGLWVARGWLGHQRSVSSTNANYSIKTCNQASGVIGSILLHYTVYGVYHIPIFSHIFIRVVSFISPQKPWFWLNRVIESYVHPVKTDHKLCWSHIYL